MKILQINDPHISDQPPSSRTLSYRDDMIEKLRQAMLIGNREQAELVIITGDLYHRKNAHHTTHQTVQDVRRALAESACPVVIIPGNHDAAPGGELNGQPILSVAGGGASVRPLAAGERLLVQWGRIVLVEWHNAFEAAGGAALLASIATQAAGSDGPLLIFAHAPISDRPFPFGPEARGWMLDADLAALLPAGSLVAYGHMHDRHDVREVAAVTFSNPGALSRASIAEHDRYREPMVALIDTEQTSVRYIPVPHRPAGEVFRLDQYEHDRERNAGIAALSDALAASYVESVDAHTLAAMLSDLPRPDGVDQELWRRGIDYARRAVEAI